MTYNVCLKTIEVQKARGNLDVDAMLNKLDVFLLAGRLTESEYNLLLELLQ